MPTVDDILGPPKVDDLLGPAPAPKSAAPPVWTPDKVTMIAGPGRITSAQRSIARNTAVGGSPTSSHLRGQAYDYYPEHGDTGRAARLLVASGTPFDQIIDEGTHVHVGYGPKNRNMAMAKGDRPVPLPQVDDFLGPPSVNDLLGPAPVAAKPAVKAIPRRAVAVPPSLMDKVAAPFKDIASRAKEYSRGGIDMLNEGARQFAPGDGQSADPVNAAMGLLKQAGGAWEAGPGAAIRATADVALGKPLETMSGGRIKPETAGEAMDQAAGLLAGGVKVRPKVGAAAKMAPLAEAVAPKVDDILGPAVAEAAPVTKPVPLTKKAAALVEEPLGPVPSKGKVAAAATEDPYDDIIFAPARARKEGTLSLPKPPTENAPKGMVEGLSDAAGAVQKIMAPATIGLGRPAAATIRRASAESDLLAAQSAHRLVEHAAKVSELPVDQQRALVGYIENRSLGAKLPDPDLQKVADDIRDVNETYRSRIEQVMGLDEGPSFIRDYYTHMWKDAPQVVEGRMAMGRQGSGRNLKARSIPTLQEGIDAGLTPLTENPIEATTLYAQNMSKYLATVDTQAELTANQMAKYYPVGGAPEGWVPLNGIRSEKPGRVIVQDGETVASKPTQKLYAPADVARVYNNWISPGLESGDAGPLFSGARKVANGMTMLKLGLSAFHATTMANEAMVSEMARGIGALSRGDLKTGVSAIGKSPGAFIGRAVRGDRMRGELLGKLEPPDGMSAAVNDAFVRSGGRVKMDNLYRTRGAGSFYNGITSGTWKRELTDTAKRIFGKEGGARPTDRAMGVVDLGANLIQSVAAPLFETYIPRLKQGAFASTMEDWLKANPTAPQKAIDEAAFHINRSIDNRFGEMAWDNLFWHRWLKQASQTLLLSPSWNLGTVNEIGGGLVDALGPSAKGLIQGKGVTTRTAYVAALAAQVALINGIMTYLKTGTRPEGKDFMAYRTGGEDASSGEPERALVPGYQKDVYAFGYDFPNHIGQEVENKLNPALKLLLENPLTGSNKDFRGLPIVDKTAPMGDQMKQGGDYLLETLMPISIGQMSKGEKVGSKMTPVERGLAIRPAPSYITAPERLEGAKKHIAQKEWKRKLRADAKADAQREKK